MDQQKEQKNIPLAGELPEKTENSAQDAKPTIVDLTAVKDYSHLPIGAQASLQLDKKSLQTENPPAKPTNNIVPKSVLKNDSSKKFFKIAVVIFGLFLLCFLGFLALSVTNLDTKFIKITLNGFITDANTGEPVVNASVLINNIEKTKTNEQGQYSISNLDYGDASVTIKADGYDDKTENVKVTKVLLDYSTRKDFSLTSSLTGVLSGKFIPTSQDYKFTNDELIIGEKQYKISDDGTFSVSNVKVGELPFSFKSISYKDISQVINVLPGNNQIPEIKLTAAGDIIGELKSYVKEDLVLNTKFYVENILQDQVTISEDGKFAVKELDTNKKYKIRVTAEGYKTRDYEINIKQGENQLFNFRLVEEGIAIFPMSMGTNETSPKRLFKSDFDGYNLEEISDNEAIDLKSKFYSIENQKLYYQSTISNTYKQIRTGKPLNVPYVFDVKTSVEDRLLIDTSNLSILSANYIAGKMFNLYIKQGSQNLQGLQIMNIDGSNRQDIKEQDVNSKTFENMIISNNGNVALYSYNTNGQDELYLFNIQNGTSQEVIKGKEITVHDISENGNLILISRENPNTSLIDLALITVSTDDLRTLKENIKGEGYQFVKGDTNKILFFEERESRSNIYTFTIDRSQEEKITSLTPDYEISGIYQESNLVFYFTNKGLLVLDLNKPKNFKLVSSEAFAYL
ncbi:MAG: carboxypeptidase regulatory-like domain-containing protein [Ignavibacteriaceae bacterium]|nr:carboxypeptidase regulatory-like domain-containing protein [Ignavibacteriaceae bacterium]